MLNHDDFYKLFASIGGARSDTLYALADHAGMPGLAQKLTASKVSWTNLLGDGRDDALAAAPLLFPIQATESPRQDSLLDWIGYRGTYTSSLVLLASPLPRHELARRLTERLDVALPENVTITLRFFDPRIFEQLVQVFSPEQRAAFLGVAHDWWFVDRRGQLRHVDSKFSEVDLLDSPLNLNQEQEHALLDASEPDQVANMLKERMPEAYQGLPAPERHDFFLRHMNAARNYGIQPTHELGLYCGLALLYGEGFSMEKEWQPVLEKVRTGNLSLTKAVMQAAAEG